MKLSDPLTAGEVALVGAGPGDAGLLTLAAASLIRDCDAVVFGALGSEDVLALVDQRAEKIPAGKRGGRPSAKQDDICDTLVRLAGEGKRVVRLKGGDPFVFGRGGEEVLALTQAGVHFRVIPGITSGIAAPAMAGIPVTDRAVNSTLAFITGHEASDDSRIDWQALVAAFPVLVIYMGTRNLAGIARKLLAAGMPDEMPVAILHAVSCPDEKQDFGTLRQAATGELVGTSPAVVIIGEVVSQRQAR
ncbi:MAG: uroporphyrinogen-III C-methyltransferase [Mariprofundaceae bacterium]